MKGVDLCNFEKNVYFSFMVPIIFANFVPLKVSLTRLNYAEQHNTGKNIA